jgi:anti-sigma B factor antagonist/stage II sporulation protein AA (anti-sigma F factor antagonist)
MDCSVKNLGGAVVVTTTGRVDLTNADAFKDVLTSALGAATSALIVDFSGVDYISSAGLRSLMIAFKAGKAAGKSFAIAGLQPLVLEIFTISRFNLVFPLFERVRDAVEKQAPDALTAFDAA